MRSPAEREQVAWLVEAGSNDGEITRRTGIPRPTVRDLAQTGTAAAATRSRGWACDLLDVSWRRMNHKTISVARRDSVAILDEFVGPKR